MKDFRSPVQVLQEAHKESDRIWKMREDLRLICGWSAKDVQDLSLEDLEDLHRQAMLIRDEP